MKVLFIDACISVHQPSRTRYLCNRYLDKMKAEGHIIEHVDLTKCDISSLTATDILKRDQLLTKGDYDDAMFDLARQFRDAERIVIGAPFWDLSFPAVLKQYIENIMVTGITFRYGEHGIPAGLCNADKVVYIMAAGGPVHGFNFGYDYVKTVFTKMLGIKESQLICAEGLDVFGADVESILQEACKDI